MNNISLYCFDIENHLIKSLGELNIRSYTDWILFKGNDSLSLVEKNLSKAKISQEECQKILEGINNFKKKYKNFEEDELNFEEDKKNNKNELNILDYIPIIKKNNEFFDDKFIKGLNKIIISKGITQFISDKENLYSIFWFFK